MDIAAVMHEIDRWPVEDQIAFIEQMWDRILDSGRKPGVTANQLTELENRVADLDLNPDDVVPLDTVFGKLNRSA